MVAPEVVALASSGATTLVGLMVTDGWTQARARFTCLLRRRHPGVEAELDSARNTLLAATGSNSERARTEVEAAWTERLTSLLSGNPEAASELTAILAEYQRNSQAGIGIHGGVFHGPVQVGGNQTNHFGEK